jgi:hypothetical protein
MTSRERQVKVQTKLTDSVNREQGDVLVPLLFNLALEFILMGLSIVLRRTREFKSTQVLAYADDISITSRSLSDATEIYTYNGLAVVAREMDSEINTNKIFDSESKGR